MSKDLDFMVRLLDMRKEEIALAIVRSGMDMSECRICGEHVVCIPDGLPCCEQCAHEEATKS